jgi:hypothetical protein
MMSSGSDIDSMALLSSVFIEGQWPMGRSTAESEVCAISFDNEPPFNDIIQETLSEPTLHRLIPASYMGENKVLPSSFSEAPIHYVKTETCLSPSRKRFDGVQWSSTPQKNEKTRSLVSAEKDMVLFHNTYLLGPGTTPYNNYVTIPHMGQSGTRLARIVSDCLKDWLTGLPLDHQQQVLRSHHVIPLKNALFRSLINDTPVVSMFDKVVIGLKVGEVSKDLKPVLIEKFDEMFHRVS